MTASAHSPSTHSGSSGGRVALLLGLLLAWLPGPVTAQVDAGATEYVLPPERVQEIFATDKNFAVLDHPSPDGNHFVIPHETELTTLERLAAPTTRLAMLELRADTDRPWHLDTYGLDGLRIYALDARTFRVVDLPEGTLISDLMWSLSGERLAFLAHRPERTELWTAEVDSGRAARLSETHVITAIGSSSQGQGSRPSRMVQWTPEGSVLTLVTPQDRGPAPTGSLPRGPIIRQTRAEEVPNPTYPFLLRSERDAALFEYHTTSQIAEIHADGRVRRIGEPGMYESLSLSPDGAHILATRVTRPFSFIAPWSNFPRVTEVLDREGRVVATLETQELQEARRRGRGSPAGDGDARDWTWIPASGDVAWLQREPTDTADAEDAPRDRVLRLSAPFDTADARVVATSEDAISDLVFSSDGAHAFATVGRDGEEAVAHWPLDEGTPAAPHLLTDWHDPDDPLTLPGEPWAARTGNGLSHVPVEDGAILMRGPGFAEDLRPTPFVDRVALADAARMRLFTGAKDSFDQPVAVVNAGEPHLIVQRESVHDFPDSFLWSEGGWENLTNNVDPFPDVTAARRVDFTFERRDGLEIRGRISLPVDYVEGTRVPAIFWTYPREYRSEDAFESATIRTRNLNAHSRMSWLRWSDIWLTQGYALVYPDIPIVGEDYNDFYISNMVDAMYGAVREVDRLGLIDIDRIGHGGHSYGAFATANFLAHTPFFKAGIAGNGAYNRTLTPQGFQAEPRDIWEAPHVYMEMSPFFKADQINTPLLMYHGADDNNTGTFPIQSERLMQALQGLGKDAVLYLYPFESHTPRAIEHNLDMWARWLTWFDRYVKGSDSQEMVGDSPNGR